MVGCEEQVRHPEHQMQSLGIFVHGVLTGLHALGLMYNLKRRNWFDAAAHTAAAAYSLSATAKHIRALETCDEVENPSLVESA